MTEITNDSTIYSITTVQEKDAIEFIKSSLSKHSGKQADITLFYDQLRFDPILNSEEYL